MRRSVLAIALVLASSATCWAQQLVAKVGTTVVGTANNGNELVCTLPNPVGPDTILRIYDGNQTTPPTQLSIPRIRIQAAIGTGAKLRVQLSGQAAPDFVDVGAFPTDPRDQIERANLTLGSIADNTTGLFFEGINGTDSNDLRNISVLAMSVNGNIHGDITVGRVFTMQATSAAETNRITANITATADDLPPASGVNPVLGELAIGVITASDGITGNIIGGTLVGTGSNEVLTGSGSIGRVRVTSSATSPEPRGIGGDIRASKDIRAIYTTGNVVSDASAPVRIEAGNSILDIRTIQDVGAGTLVERQVAPTFRPTHLGLCKGQCFSRSGPGEGAAG